MEFSLSNKVLCVFISDDAKCSGPSFSPQKTAPASGSDRTERHDMNPGTTSYRGTDAAPGYKSSILAPVPKQKMTSLIAEPKLKMTCSSTEPEHKIPATSPVRLKQTFSSSSVMELKQTSSLVAEPKPKMTSSVAKPERKISTTSAVRSKQTFSSSSVIELKQISVASATNSGASLTTMARYDLKATNVGSGGELDSQKSAQSHVEIGEPDFILIPGTFEVILCVDNQEFYGSYCAALPI